MDDEAATSDEQSKVTERDHDVVVVDIRPGVTDPETRLPTIAPFQAQMLEPLTTAMQSMVTNIIRDAKITEAFGEQWADMVKGLHDAALGAAYAPLLSFRASYLNALAVNLRGMDQVTSFGVLGMQRTIMAQWAEQSIGFGALTSWRLSLQADSMIEGILGVRAWQQSRLALELSRIGQAHVSLTDWAVRVDASSHLLGEVSGRPLGLWRDQLAGLREAPTFGDLRAVTMAGQVGLALVGADLATSGAADEALVGPIVRRVETEVLHPWEQGRLTAARKLYERLGEIDPTVPELLEGAWEDLDRRGPGAVSKAAHCSVEALDRILRAAAPDDEVRSWHSTSGRPAKEWEGRDKPTRSLRIKFIVRGLGSERTVAVGQFESLATMLTPLHGRLEAAKHASQGDVTIVRSLLLSAESLLTMLFLSSVDDV